MNYHPCICFFLIAITHSFAWVAQDILLMSSRNLISSCIGMCCECLSKKFVEVCLIYWITKKFFPVVSTFVRCLDYPSSSSSRSSLFSCCSFQTVCSVHIKHNMLGAEFVDTKKVIYIKNDILSILTKGLARFCLSPIMESASIIYVWMSCNVMSCHIMNLHKLTKSDFF